MRVCIYGSWQRGRLLVLSVNEDNDFMTTNQNETLNVPLPSASAVGEKPDSPSKLPFPFLLCSNSSLPDHLLFGHRV